MQAYDNLKLTRPPPFYLLCRNSENIQHFRHYLHDDVHHRCTWLNLRIRFQAFEKVLDPLKYVDQCLLGRTNVLSRLTSLEVKLDCKRSSEDYKDSDLEENTGTSEDDFRG
jgi:hypothetical protein